MRAAESERWPRSTACKSSGLGVHYSVRDGGHMSKMTSQTITINNHVEVPETSTVVENRSGDILTMPN